MDLSMKYWPFLLLIGVVVAIQDPTQYGHIVCNLDDDGYMKLNMSVVSNGSFSTVVHFTDSFGLEDYNATECLWSVTGNNESFLSTEVRIDLTTDSAPNGKSGCGVNVLESGKIYNWIAIARWRKGFFYETDLFLNLTCDITKRLPSFVSAIVTQRYPDTHYLRAIGGQVSLKALGMDNNEATDLNAGDQFRLELSYLPGPFNASLEGDDTLKPWGAFCKKLYAIPTEDASDYRMPLLNKGCPITSQPFLLPTNGFLSSFDPLTNSIQNYNAYTGYIKAAGFKGSNGVRIFCEAWPCYRRPDLRCIDTCGALNKRKRRADDGPFLLVTTLTIKHSAVESDSESLSTPDFFWPLVGGIGGAVFLLVSCLVCVLLRSRKTASASKYARHSDSPSVTSDISSKMNSKSAEHSSFSNPKL